MLHGAINKFLKEVLWDDLDYLLVDLPPGTGDVQISLAQSIPLTGAVIVTTPQDVALLDVRKSISMFEKVKVPILGVVENMSGFDCPHCHKSIDLYDGKGGETLSQEFKIPLLTKVPFNPAVGLGGDQGKPITLSQPDSAQGKAFRQAAEKIVERIKVLNEVAIPVIQID